MGRIGMSRGLGLLAAISSLVAFGVQEKITVSPEEMPTPGENQIISSAAVKALRHVADARDAVNQKKWKIAKDDLNQANTLFKIIEAEVPVYRVQDRIYIANKHLNYEDAETVKAELVPIYSELDLLEENGVATKQARQHLDAANQRTQAGDKKGAQKELSQITEGILYTTVSVPVDRAESLIQTALRDIDGKDGKKAQAALKQVENSLETTVVTVVPKAKGSENSSAGTSSGAKPNSGAPSATGSPQKAQQPSSNTSSGPSSSEKTQGTTPSHSNPR